MPDHVTSSYTGKSLDLGVIILDTGGARNSITTEKVVVTYPQMEKQRHLSGYLSLEYQTFPRISWRLELAGVWTPYVVPTFLQTLPHFFRDFFQQTFHPSFHYSSFSWGKYPSPIFAFYTLGGFLRPVLGHNVINIAQFTSVEKTNSTKI